jgi:hypothetical protein
MDRRAERLRARTAEQGGPSITLLPAALWQEMEASPLKYVARGAQNTSYGSAFRVPSQGWLRAHGVEADYLVAPANFTGGVIVEYDQTGAMTTHDAPLGLGAADGLGRPPGAPGRRHYLPQG